MVANKKVKRIDLLATIILWSGSLITAAVLIWIIGFIVIKGLPVININFLLTSPKGIMMEGGVFPAIVASLYITLLSLLFATPIGVGAAIYLAEYAPANKTMQLIRFLSDSLASVPSIIFGIFGLALFVEVLNMGWSILAGALTLTIMILPTIIRTSEESLRAVPQSFRHASLGIGASNWQTVFKIAVPSALPGILTGLILGIGRAFGETAALLYTSGMAVNLPKSPLDTGATLTVVLYRLITINKVDSAYGAAFILLILVLLINLGMKSIMNKIRKKYITG